MSLIIENVERVIREATSKYIREVVASELGHFAYLTEEEILDDFCLYFYDSEETREVEVTQATIGSSEHCKDCCCAHSWTALGVSEYTGRSIPEHIAALRADNQRLQQERDKAQARFENARTKLRRLFWQDGNEQTYKILAEAESRATAAEAQVRQHEMDMDAAKEAWAQITWTADGNDFTGKADRCDVQAIDALLAEKKGE